MAYLIFCSYEVGGIPFKMAEVLNRNGVQTYYVSVHQNATGHDSSAFHYGDAKYPWDLSVKLINKDQECLAAGLRNIARENHIEGCLATGHLSWILEEAGITYSYWSYGSDLDQQCYLPVMPRSLLSLRSWWHSYLNLRTRYAAIKTIRHAHAIWISSYQLTSLEKISPGKEMFFLPHLLEPHELSSLSETKLKAKKQLHNRLGCTGQVFFSATRHFWDKSHSFMSDNKGNDVLIAAFARYLKDSGKPDAKLLLIKKGPDVNKSMALVNDLGILDYVIWLEEMRRDELLEIYLAADICLGQFGTAVLSGAAIEPLACATPVVSFFSDGPVASSHFYLSPPPIFNSKSVDDISHYMVKVMSDPDKLSKLSKASVEWVKSNCSEKKFIEQFVAAIRARQTIAHLEKTVR